MQNDTATYTKKSNKGKWLGLFTLLLLIVLGSFVLLSNKQSDESVAESALRKPSDLAIEIAQYEMFYQDYAFHSNQLSRFFGLTEMLDHYALINYLSDTEIAWDEEKRQFYRAQIVEGLQYDRQNQFYNDYIEKLLADLNITIDQYIDEYLLPVEEADRLMNTMFEKAIKLQDNAYPSGDVQKQFYRQMGYTDKMLDDMVKKTPKYEPLNPQPTDLPFTVTEGMSAIGLNEQGEYVFVEPQYMMNHLSDAHKDVLYQFEYETNGLNLNRSTLDYYIEAIEQLGEQELVEILTMYKRSIELQFEMIN